MEILFWIFFFIIIYSYVIYPVILLLLSWIRKLFSVTELEKPQKESEPEVTLFVAAYNEANFIEQKIKNSLSLNYPAEKINHVWITDGSNDGTPEILKKYHHLQVYHQPERNGKTGAINRGMQFIKTPIVIFSDANSILNKDAIRYIVKAFSDPRVGCVAGEKRIKSKNKENAVNAGEGIYWKYESLIKSCESDIYSAIGAVGELFAIRTELFDTMEPDTILDDFIISMRIALKGFRIKYEPRAIATEGASINIKEELKRKTRIAYGGFQSIGRLKQLLNFLKYPKLSFLYISHKIIRWSALPFSFIFIFIINFYLAYQNDWEGLFSILFALQLIFYSFVFLGAALQKTQTNLKFFFAPYYLFIMNYAEFIGFIRFVRKKQSINWERAKRE